jgi:hypothetical protein
MNYRQLFSEHQRQRVSDGALVPIWPDHYEQRLLVLICPQLGDFDTMEYAWWLVKHMEQLTAQGITVRAVAIGDLASGQRFCDYTGFPTAWLQVDPTAQLHIELNLYGGLNWKLFGKREGLNAWANLMAMCAGIGSPGTLKEVLRGYKGDRSAPQLIRDEETIQAKPLPGLKGSFFKLAGGSGFQRPFELATLRLKNMGEALSQWHTYVPDSRYLTQRGGTFLFDYNYHLVYEHRDRGILGFAKNMANPLDFLGLENSAVFPLKT